MFDAWLSRWSKSLKVILLQNPIFLVFQGFWSKTTYVYSIDMYIYMSLDRAHRTVPNGLSFIIGSIEGTNS